ncbi:DUF4136 domain-containing protein [Cyclobacterium roseum]|uniref:DUF4136 domain-containing protein n=1 Tax=Cyclobacterium roseum TaxID=2666137 RepID=UPI001390C4B6|nr:DUF4136 domain-containing protein [Cyclobacterium roseum]
MNIGQGTYIWKLKEVPMVTYKEGSLRLHLIENQSNEAVWAGTIRRTLPKKTENAPETIGHVVEKRFKGMTKKLLFGPCIYLIDCRGR